MDIILVAVGLIWFFTMPFLGGFLFLYGGISFLLNFDSEFDDPRKKWRAALDIVLGAALLISFHVAFWLIIYPCIVSYYGLNLPTL